MTIYTSLKLSKLLKENGCDLQPKFANRIEYDSPCWYKVFKSFDISKFKIEISRERPYYDEDYELSPEIIVPAYDIIYDICIKKPKKFFTTKKTLNYKYFTNKIFEMVRDGASQKRIEDYIWDNCLFNPKNKEKK